MKSPRDKTAPSTTRELRDDVVWEDDDVGPAEELAIAPLDPATEASRRAIRESTMPAVESEVAESAQPSSFQFSLRHMLIGQGCVAALLALTRIVAPSMLAGALGITALVMAVLLAVFQPQERLVLVAWWSMFSLYLAACLLAVVSA